MYKLLSIGNNKQTLVTYTVYVIYAFKKSIGKCNKIKFKYLYILPIDFSNFVTLLNFIVIMHKLEAIG